MRVLLTLKITGGLFLIGGVIMFFDRSLYVALPHTGHGVNRLTRVCVNRLAMGNARAPIALKTELNTH